MAHADLHVDGHENAEVDRVDPQSHRHRKEDGGEDEDDGRRLHEVAGGKQQDVDRQQEGDLAGVMGTGYLTPFENRIG